MPEANEDSELGRFAWDDWGRGRWLGGIQLPPGNPVYFVVRLGASERDAVLPLARAAAVRARDWETEARRLAVAKLLPAADPHTASRAVDKLRLNDLTVSPDGGVMLSYEGSDEIPEEFVVWLAPDGQWGVSSCGEE